MKHKAASSFDAILDSFRLFALWPRRKRFVGDGFEIHSTSTWEFEYREGNRILKVATEHGHGDSGNWFDSWEVVHLDTPLRWQPLYDGDLISKEKKAQIKANIEKYYDTFRIPVEILE